MPVDVFEGGGFHVFSTTLRPFSLISIQEGTAGGDWGHVADRQIPASKEL